VFKYAAGRGGHFAEEFLNGFKGRFLQCDGYEGYDRLTRLDRGLPLSGDPIGMLV